MENQENQKEQDKFITACPYCTGEVTLVTGKTIYPHRKDLFNKHFYLCMPCNAYVGCHPNSKRPLGRLANAELRRAKSAAHALFDPIWKQGMLSRSNAYKWLSDQLGISREETHIGMFDVDTCKRVMRICKGFKGAYLSGAFKC